MTGSNRISFEAGLVDKRRIADLNKKNKTVAFLIEEVSALTGEPAASLSEDTRLIGGDTGLNSLNLVRVLLALEEFSADRLHVHFDWTNDSAMSENSSVFRTIGSLAEHISSLRS